jgi:hypothetical protein
VARQARPTRAVAGRGVHLAARAGAQPAGELALSVVLVQTLLVGDVDAECLDALTQAGDLVLERDAAAQAASTSNSLERVFASWRYPARLPRRGARAGGGPVFSGYR